MSRIDPPPGPRVSVSDMETRVARFDKLARRYLAFVHFVAACILLR